MEGEHLQCMLGRPSCVAGFGWHPVAAADRKLGQLQESGLVALDKSRDLMLSRETFLLSCFRS